MVMINERTWLQLSAIIAVCGNNFCSLVADTRMVTNVGAGYVPVSEDTDKIFKLNDRVLFGATGLFRAGCDTILDAVDGIEDIEHATPDSVLEHVLAFVEEAKFDMPPSRSYIVGGRRDDGSFCVYNVHVNFNTMTVETERFVPGDGEFGVSVALPSRAVPHKDRYISLVNRAISSSRTHGELLCKVAEVVASVADVDSTVNKNIKALTV